jgi:ABC-type multidrug transport system fused ATPase/permease subunit
MSSWFYSILILIIEISIGILPSALVIFEARFIDMAILILHDGKMNIIIYIIPIIVLLSIQWVASSILAIVKTYLLARVRLYIYPIIIEKKAQLEYKNYENEKICNTMKRVSDKIDDKIVNTFFQLLTLISSVVLIISLLGILLQYLKVYTLLILIIIVPMIMLAIKSGKANFDAQSDAMIYIRKAEYLEEVLCSRDTANERCLYNYENEINTRWKNNIKKYNSIIIKIRFKWFLKMKLGASIMALINLVITLLLLKPVVNGIITFGIFTSLVNASYKLVNKLSWEMTDLVDKLAKNSVYISDLILFLDFEEAKQNVQCISKVDLNESEVAIELRNVTFKYPNSETNILENVSFKIIKGKKYALVGINGAGKTTILKLILGLYNGYEGEIFINGIEVRNLSRESINNEFAVVFQDFAKYEISMMENLKLSLDVIDEDLEEKVKNICNKLGLQELIEKWPKGLNTILGKVDEDGYDVSVGQWQKIAIVRAALKDAPISIMDEPGSALDPIAELELFQEYDTFVKGDTSITISHRLGGIKDFENIIVLNGKNVESIGSHKELYSKNELYREMYETQKGWYMYETEK